MFALSFIYGLAFFSLGLAVFFETWRKSQLALGRQLPWLAAFGLIHGLVEWTDMFLLVPGAAPWSPALMLVRFGVGLVAEVGPPPRWVVLAPLVLATAAGLLWGYGVIVAITGSPYYLAVDLWSRYLLYLPASALAAFGLFRQWRALPPGGVGLPRHSLFGAALAFALHSLVGGLVASQAPYALAPWLNADAVRAWTGLPLEAWRALSAVAVAVFAIRALRVFEAERRQQIAELQLAHARAQVAARQEAEEWAQALTTIGRDMAEMRDLDEVLLGVVQAARRLLRAETGALALLKGDNSLHTRCVVLPDGAHCGLDRPVRSNLLLDCVRAATPHLYPDDAALQPGPIRCPFLEREVRAIAAVPLLIDGRPVGALWVSRLEEPPFTHADLAGLGRLADQAGVALRHAAMAERLQSLAVTEERGRIAREMHDGLAQILGYLNLELQTLESLSRGGDQEALRRHLRQARAQVQQAHADVRQNILSLRTTLAEGASMITALREYVEEFGVQAGLDARCSASGAPYRLSALVEVQLLRIVQEALTNVRRHARARSVEVTLRPADGGLALAIVDDGVGFDVVPAGGHFGLQTMQERAVSVGGRVEVRSRPGAGTTVAIWLPLRESPALPRPERAALPTVASLPVVDGA